MIEKLCLREVVWRRGLVHLRLSITDIVQGRCTADALTHTTHSALNRLFARSLRVTERMLSEVFGDVENFADEAIAAVGGWVRGGEHQATEFHFVCFLLNY